MANVRSQHRKLYVQVKGTEDIIEIDVDKNRPKKFASNNEAEEWENKTLREILKYRKLIEEGKYVPEEVVNRLQVHRGCIKIMETELNTKTVLVQKVFTIILIHTRLAILKCFNLDLSTYV